MVRDIALSVSGLITHKLGGPASFRRCRRTCSTTTSSIPSYWKPAEGPERYRRTVYGFRKRSMPDPVMSSFDAPNGDFACARRVRSNTPLAALTGLNETIFVEAARALALASSARRRDRTMRQRADYAFRLVHGCDAHRRRNASEMLALAASRGGSGWPMAG